MLVKNMNVQDEEILLKRMDFKTEKKVKYLEVTLTNMNYMLFQNNYVKVRKDFKQDLLRWDKLQLSLLDRISVIKMNVLSRMLFLFQTVLILTTGAPFKEWQKDISKLV